MKTANVIFQAPKWPVFAFVVVALILSFVLDAGLRIFPAAVVTGFAGYACLFCVESALRSGVVGGACYRPVTKELKPIKFWMTCVAFLVVGLGAIGFSVFVLGGVIFLLASPLMVF